MKTFKLFLAIVIAVSLICLAGAAAAQSTGTITGVKLETASLTMEIGESYQFNPTFTKEDPDALINAKLHLFSTDENVVKASDEINTIEAIGGGNAKIFAYTNNYEFSAVCTITVKGDSKSVTAKGDVWTNPDGKQLAKIKDPSLKAFFELLGSRDMADAAGNLAKQNKFKTLVTVTHGRAKSLADAMSKMGMEQVHAFDLIDTIVVRGTAEQYVVLLRSDNVLSINEDPSYGVDDDGAGENMLEGQAENISHFAAAYGLDLSGEGTVVAILDTGINPDHEQFTGKEGGSIIAQACFSTDDEDYDIFGVCEGDDPNESLESAAINSNVNAPSEFYHGTHVAAIAAGKNGVAPKADIIAVNVFHEEKFWNKNYYGEYVPSYDSRVYWSDLARGLDYLLYLYEENPSLNLTAVNMSLGGDKETKACKRNDADLDTLMNILLSEHRVISAISSGNNGYDGAIHFPSCAPSAFAVGALWDSGEPEVANYSNHSKLVDILAPGSQVYSATSETDNSYEAWNGTSMATPMVTGAIALLRQKYPDASVTMIETLLTGMTTQTAARAKVTKPVLDFANFPDVAEFLENGPEVNVYGGNGFLQIDFSTIPLPTEYTLKVNDPETGKTVKTFTGKNLKTAKITKLTNNKPYEIQVTCIVPNIDATYQQSFITAQGMPMVPGTGYTLDWYTTEDNDPKLVFGWNPEANAEAEVHWKQTYWYTPDVISLAEESAEADAIFNSLVTADFYKKVTVGGDTYLSVPTTLQTFPLRSGSYKSFKFDNGKIYFTFNEAFEGLSGREIKIVNYDTGKTIKTVKADVKKNPKDILISGIKAQTNFVVYIRNYATVGKKTYTGDWYSPYWYYTESPDEHHYEYTMYVYKYDKNYGDYPYTRKFFSGVSVAAGDQSVKVSYNRDLTLDGYRFQIKPIDPNRKKINESAAIKKAQDGYTIGKLTNGWVYKLRFQGFFGSASKPIFTTFYPNPHPEIDWNSAANDNAWKGVYFIPLSAPEVTDLYVSNGSKRLSLKDDKDADGTIMVWVNSNDPLNPVSIVTTSTDIDLDSLDEEFRSGILMHYKEWNGHTFYGPATYLDLTQESSELAVGYGPKSAEQLDLNSMPIFAGAAQIDGKPVLDLEQLAAKGISEFITEEGDAEILVDAEFYDVIDYDAKDADEAEAEIEPADEAEIIYCGSVIPGPHTIDEEDLSDEDPDVVVVEFDDEGESSEEALEPKNAAESVSVEINAEEDSFESYEEPVYDKPEDGSEEASESTEEKKDQGFSWFFFGK